MKLEKGVFVPTPFEPNTYKIANVTDALRAIGHIAETVQPPVWLRGSRTEPIIAGQIVPLANGILTFATRELEPHTPELFELHVLPFAYDPAAPTPTRWLRFLAELWPDDEESQRTLAEWFGYVLSSDTAQQKMYLLVGPKRSGKGTIARVLTGLLGAHNTAAPTLAGLTQNFGLQTLIGKPVAVISDARLGSRADNMIAVERVASLGVYGFDVGRITLYLATGSDMAPVLSRVQPATPGGWIGRGAARVGVGRCDDGRLRSV